MATSSGLTDLTSCSICLETFTRPKMLPCQHTYCYSCLLSIGKDQTKITCPQCREEHDIPTEGMSAFRDNILVNNLLGLCIARQEIPCADCQSKPAVSPCEHCNATVCASCFSEHIKLSTELEIALDEIKGDMNLSWNSDERRKEIHRSKETCDMQLEQLKDFSERKLRELYQTYISLENSLRMISRVHEDILQIPEIGGCGSDESYVRSLTEKAGHCRTVDSLKSLRNDVGDLKTVLRLLQSPQGDFMFVPNESLQEANTVGQIEIGQVVVEFKGYQAPQIGSKDLTEIFEATSLRHIPEPSSFACHPEFDSHDRNDSCCSLMKPRSPEPLAQVPKSDAMRRSPVSTTSREPTSNSESSNLNPALQLVAAPSAQSKMEMPTAPAVLDVVPRVRKPDPPSTVSVQSYRQNQLPSNVDFERKNRGWVAVIQPKIKGPTDFRGAAYHSGADEIYIADCISNRVLVYQSSGRFSRVFYEVMFPLDVAISSDGMYVYIAARGLLIKANLRGGEVKTIHECSLGPLNDCIAVVCHNEFTVLVDRQFRCIIVYDESGRELRHFGRKYLEEPTAVAISSEGEMFVTDDDDRNIEVFKWNGQFVETFLNGESQGTYGEVAIDADGYIYVTNKIAYRIDVFNGQRQLITTISGPGKRPGLLWFPFRITLTHDSKIIITDRIDGKNRLQIF